MKRFVQSFCIAALTLLLHIPLLASDSLGAVLSRMDRDAPAFHALTADVTMITYTKVIDDHTTETGRLQMQKLGPNEVRAVIAFTGADQARTVALLGKAVKIFYPQLNGYKQYDLGSQSQVADQLLLLGFGSSGSDLSKSYNIEFLGSEDVNGQQTSKLELVPKDANVQSHVAKVDLWIPLDSGNPIQQQFFDPPSTGNWRKVTYTHTDLNPAIKGKLDLTLPKSAKKLPD